MRRRAAIAHPDENPELAPADVPLAGARRLTLVLSAFAAVMACLDLLGWLLHLPLLTSVLPHYATMKPNTAACILLLAVAVAVPRGLRVLPITASFAAFAISALSVLEYALDANFGLDQMLLAVPPASSLDPAGRMSIATGVCLALVSLAILLRDRLPRTSVAATVIGIVIASAGLLGFLFDAGPLVAVPAMRSLAVHTAAALLLLGWACLASRPKREPYFTLSEAAGRQGSRRGMLLAVTLLPVLIALPVVGGLAMGQYNGRFALALLLVLLLMVQTGSFWKDSRDLQRARARLNASEAWARLILQSIGDAVIVTDARGLVTGMNPVAEQLTGWTTAQASGKHFDEVFVIRNDSTGETLKSPLAETIRTGQIVALSNHALLIGKHGGETHIEDSCAPILEPDGGVSGAVLVFRNVDERKALEAERRRANSALIQSEKLAAVGRLASSIAHEINNPLESVTNLLYLMRDEQDAPTLRSYADIAEKELLRVSAIANQTLSFNRQSRVPTPVDLPQLIAGVLAVYHGKLLNGGATVEVRMRVAQPVLCFDGEIRQVVGNLIGNALDAMTQGPPGRLLIRGRSGHRWRDGEPGVVLTIADTGSGMPPETVKRIFEPFFTTKGLVGTGLGLWISHEIVARHKGTLSVRSRSTGARRGTVFVLFLPFAAALRSDPAR